MVKKFISTWQIYILFIDRNLFGMLHKKIHTMIHFEYKGHCIVHNITDIAIYSKRYRLGICSRSE